MPLYEYECKKDGRFELIRKFSDPPLKACPTCGQPIEKLLSSPAIQFKGSGWYITDYARKGNGSESGGDKGKGESSAKTESSSKDSGAKESGSKDGGSKDSGSKSEGSASAKKTTSSGSSAS